MTLIGIEYFVSGLKTALIEGDDFASGTSSRSTKLIHGGVRYLQKAILGVSILGSPSVKRACNGIDLLSGWYRAIPHGEGSPSWASIDVTLGTTLDTSTPDHVTGLQVRSWLLLTSPFFSWVDIIMYQLTNAFFPDGGSFHTTGLASNATISLLATET